MTRTAILGGEAPSRGLLGGGRSKRENKIRYGFGGAAVVAWYMTGGMGGLAFAAVIAGIGFVLTLKTMSGGSVISNIVLHWRWRRRSRKLLTQFVPPEVEEDLDEGLAGPPSAADPPADADPAKRKPAANPKRRKKLVPVRSVPDGVGNVRQMVYASPAGGTVSVLVHNNPAVPAYLTAVLEVEGQPTGLYEQEDIDASAERFGRLLVGCAGPTSLIRGVQVITRVVPVDSAEHE